MTPAEEQCAFAKLSQSAQNATVETCEDLIEQTEQPGAAKLLFAALAAIPKFGQREHVGFKLLQPGTFPPEDIKESIYLYVSAPSITGNHFDFAIFGYDHTGRLLGKIGWRRAVVEVEANSSGAPEVSSSFLGRGSKGKDVMSVRFSEAELIADPWGCASKLYDWASCSFG